jgi:hypothetical protein
MSPWVGLCSSARWGPRRFQVEPTGTSFRSGELAKAGEKVYERFETACDDLDSGLLDLNLDKHCYCCMQFFGGAGSSVRRNVDGHVWCMASSYQVHGRDVRGGQHPSSRPPSAPTTAAVAALAAVFEVENAAHATPGLVLNAGVRCAARALGRMVPRSGVVQAQHRRV